MSWTTMLINSICEEKGYEIISYPSQPSMCQITFPEGSSTLFYSSTLNINGAASRIGAIDKDYTKFFLRNAGVSVPDGGIVFSDMVCDENNLTDNKNSILSRYEDEEKFPLIVKPTRGFQGRSVYKVYNNEQLDVAVDMVLEVSRSALVEECVTGQEYRLVWYKGVLQAAYKKTPLRVMGDGVHSIGELIDKKRLNQVEAGRGDMITPYFSYLEERLHGLGYTMDSILPSEVVLNLRDNANLSTGGDVIDFTDNVHEDYVKLISKIAKVVDLSLIGIDIIVKTPISEPLDEYWILEVAYTPGMHHFSSLGESQYEKVKAMYSDIIEQLRNERNARIY